jgi:hypothetical protein
MKNKIWLFLLFFSLRIGVSALFIKIYELEDTGRQNNTIFVSFRNVIISFLIPNSLQGMKPTIEQFVLSTWEQKSL